MWSAHWSTGVGRPLENRYGPPSEAQVWAALWSMSVGRPLEHGCGPPTGAWMWSAHWSMGNLPAAISLIMNDLLLPHCPLPTVPMLSREKCPDGAVTSWKIHNYQQN